MTTDFPANPASIELTMQERKLWWQTDHTGAVEDRHISADVWEPESCPPEHRHVSDLSMTIVRLDGEWGLLDSVGVGAWGTRFVDEAVHGRDGGLHPQLEQKISRGPARLLVIHGYDVSAGWRRRRHVGTALMAAALMAFAQTARLAACRPSLGRLPETYRDRLEAEEALERWTSLLESVGFWEWHGVYVVDLRDGELERARGKLLTCVADGGEEAGH